MIDIASTILDVIKEVLGTLFSLPFKAWYWLPDPIKYAIYAFLILLMIVIAALVFKYRNEWAHRLG